MKLNAVMITRKNTEGIFTLDKCDPRTAYDIVQFFGAPIQTYNLKQDVFEYCHRNYDNFAHTIHEIEQQTKQLLEGLPCYILDIDVKEASRGRSLFELLMNGL